MAKLSERRRSLPGDPSPEKLLERAIRVDHAGEYGARRIYEGQLAVLGDTRDGPVIEEMHAQEARHLDFFDAAIVERGVRPTVLHPLWHLAGYGLGVASALAGPRAAMATTVAVEEAIDEHYAEQIAQLADIDPELTGKLTEFREDENEHRETGLAHGAEQAPGYRLMRRLIKTGCRVAIRLSERL